MTVGRRSGDVSREAPPARARLIDVARRAGVSKAAASKVLNATPGFSARPETRTRVIEAAAALGYRPHIAARALATSRAGTLALLVPELTNLTYVTIARGAYDRAAERGYVLVLAEDFGRQSAVAPFQELVAEGRVDGLIIASARPGHETLPALKRSDIPHVFLNRAVCNSGRNVVMDVGQSSRLAAAHLAELGHTHVAHIAGPRGIAPSDNRAAAFRSSARELGLRVTSVAHVEFSEAGGVEGARQVLTGRATGVYASSLAQAIGVLHGARELGISVPADVSVIGNDDFPIAGYLTPPLTTVAMPLRELGRSGVDVLVDQLEGREPEDFVVPTTPHLVNRASTAPPPDRRPAGRIAVAGQRASRPDVGVGTATASLPSSGLRRTIAEQGGDDSADQVGVGFEAAGAGE